MKLVFTSLLDAQALADALKKGESRHRAFANFHRTSPRSKEHHAAMALKMRGLRVYVEREIAKAA